MARPLTRDEQVRTAEQTLLAHIEEHDPRSTHLPAPGSHSHLHRRSPQGTSPLTSPAITTLLTEMKKLITSVRPLIIPKLKEESAKKNDKKPTRDYIHEPEFDASVFFQFRDYEWSDRRDKFLVPINNAIHTESGKCTFSRSSVKVGIKSGWR